MASTKRVLDLLETKHTIKNSADSIELDDFNQDIIR